jgi:hypothetical protein
MRVLHPRSEKLRRRLRRIVVVVVVTLGTVVIGAEWVAPVVLSIDTARKPPRVARLVPVNLQDLTVSKAPARKLSYFGYEFEIPWTDVDETKTKSYPNMVLLTFHSGLKLMVGTSPPKFWLNEIFERSKITQTRVEQTFGIHSDYDFFVSLYNFTPDKIHLWALSRRVHYRETYMLGIKSVVVGPEAETGFFYVGNPNV